jgi:hypothetical protein
VTNIRQEDLEKAKVVSNICCSCKTLCDCRIKNIAQALANQREHIIKGCEGMYSEVKGSEIAKALKKYAKHLDYCSNFYFSKQCDCGLWEMIGA